jgi:acyl-CoA synthetase (AMP-forming)/AMP-acid ligase II
MNLVMLLDMAADGFAARTVVGNRTTGYTAAHLRRLSLGGAAAIREAGAETLIYIDVNGPAYPVALFSAAHAGVPLVPINFRLGAGQLLDLLAKHPRSVVIAGPRAQELFDRVNMTVLTTQEWLVTADLLGHEEALSDPDDDGPAVIIYTSGTTAAPKGVVLRHHNLVSYVLGSVEFGAADGDEATLVSVPPYHVGAVANVITNLYAGRRYIALERFTGEQWLELVRSERVTHALVVPTMLARIMSAEGDLGVPTLRSLAYGGARMPVRVIVRALTQWPHVDFVNAYGLTETSSTISVLGPEEHRDALVSVDAVVRARLSSAGLVHPGIELEIRDEFGERMPPGGKGHIWVRGEQVSGEYTGTGSALDERGFFDTRDEGYLDAVGYLFIDGRADDTIIRGGENIAPAEIEDTLLSHDDVEDAVVVGVPDPDWGQRLEAAIVAKPGRTVDPDAVRSFVRQHLRSSKTPDRIVVWPELPRNETGKLMRRHALQLLVAEQSTED